MNFIKKIVDGKIDESVHLQFQKFSRGEFKNRAVLKVKKSKNRYTINSGPEFARGFVRMLDEKLGDNSTKVTGAVISTVDLTGKINFKEKKQFQGVKRYLLDDEMTGKKIINLLDQFPKTFFALTFSVDENCKLKIKPKAPKSGKPGKKGEEPKADFCKFITNDSEIGRSFVFEKDDFKLAEIKHTFLIEKIILPEGEGEDFSKIREMAKRQGKIIRYSNIDDLKAEKSYDFIA